MITYPFLRTKRIAVRLRELTLGEAVELLGLPAERHELGTTELLRRIAKDAEAPREGYVTDPRLWTVEERAYLVCNYLTMVTDDGPNFSVGDRRMTDYLTMTDDLPAPWVDLGKVGGEATRLYPLLGVHAEALEVLCGTSRLDWVVGAVACQMRAADAAEPDWLALTSTEMLSWVKDRMEAIKAMPESECEEVLTAFFHGQEGLFHFARPVFGDDGILWSGLTEEEAGIPPARFLSVSCISPTTKALLGRTDRPDSEPGTPHSHGPG